MGELSWKQTSANKGHMKFTPHDRMTQLLTLKKVIPTKTQGRWTEPAKQGMTPFEDSSPPGVGAGPGEFCKTPI